MKTVCDLNMCSGCRSCLTICPRKAIVIHDEMDNMNSVIDETLCNNCGSCKKICPINNPPEKKKPIVSYQGWANDKDIRSNSSSGGVASAIIKKFVETDGFVASCKYDNGDFCFILTNSKDAYKAFRGSKYIKSNAGKIYAEILNALKSGVNVLFVGLPCQVGALKNRIPVRYHDSLFTIDLICHGTPSLKCLELYLNEKHHNLKEIKSLKFRHNNNFSLTSENTEPIEGYIADCYSISFLNGLNYTSNCYHCQFAQLNRCSDITLGDSWGSSFEKTEKDKGISLILCQTEKGLELIKKADLNLKDVDLQNAIEHNHQLQHPSVEPRRRKWFFEHLKKGNMKYSTMVFRLYPMVCIKQKIKYLLIKCKIKKAW